MNPYSDPLRSGGDITPGGGAGRGTQGTIGRRGKEGESRPIKTTIGNGLRFDSPDGEFQLQFHNLTQAELRNFPGAGGQSPLKTQFFIPRQRWYFTGRATKNVEFYTVINRGYGSLDLLDAFINFNYDPRFQFRVGRTKTPTSYEYYQIAEGDLIAPERSLFIGNLAGNRQEGFMLHGQIFEKSAEYAAGVFNGPRRSFGDFNNDKDLFLFYNMRPFQNTEADRPEILQRRRRVQLRTRAEPHPAGRACDRQRPDGVEHRVALADVLHVQQQRHRERLARPLVDLDRLVLQELQRPGRIRRDEPGLLVQQRQPARTRIPFEGFSVTPYYFLTGERITRRVDVKPDRDFGIKNGRITGPGAVEIYSRFSALNLGHDVFTAGFADRNLWTNQRLRRRHGIELVLEPLYENLLRLPVFRLRQPRLQRQESFASHYNLLWLRFQLFF